MQGKHGMGPVNAAADGVVQGVHVDGGEIGFPWHGPGARTQWSAFMQARVEDSSRNLATRIAAHCERHGRCRSER
jgi:hypothetical protein